MYLRGKTPRSRNESYFKVSRINTSIAFGDQMIPVDDFLGMLREGRFEAGYATRSGTAKESAPKPKPKPPPKSHKRELPSVDTRAARAKAAADLGLDPSGWRREGLLSLSGYRVGKSRGRPANIRHKILNTIVLYDDLTDVPDRGYAAQWGPRGSRQRYKKTHDSIKTFLNNGKRKDGPVDMTAAIEDWEGDLEYLETQLKFYIS
jgi:hypothetical protein